MRAGQSWVPEGRNDGLIIEHLDREMLVYDTASDEAHCLDPVAAAEFEAASDDVSRREVIRRLALVGAAAAGAAPLVKSIVAPTPAAAASTCVPACDVDMTCCGGVCKLLNGQPCSMSSHCCSGCCVSTCMDIGFCP